MDIKESDLPKPKIKEALKIATSLAQKDWESIKIDVSSSDDSIGYFCAIKSEGKAAMIVESYSNKQREALFEALEDIIEFFEQEVGKGKIHLVIEMSLISGLRWRLRSGDVEQKGLISAW